MDKNELIKKLAELSTKLEGRRNAPSSPALVTRGAISLRGGHTLTHDDLKKVASFIGDLSRESWDHATDVLKDEVSNLEHDLRIILNKEQG